MRKPLVAGNWKMNGTREASAELAASICSSAPFRCDVVVIPPVIYMQKVSGLLKSESVLMGAQNVNSYEQGAYTGEISAPMIREFGCSYCLVGHSERRMLFGESNETTVAKIETLLKYQIQPILCVGETIEQRNSGHTVQVVSDQLRSVLDFFSPSDLANALIAYEPVWAIGTGETASPRVAGEVHGSIREIIRGKDQNLADSMRILYGGSVNPSNAYSLMSEVDIDGALVGGASLSSIDFIKICNLAGEN